MPNKTCVACKCLHKNKKMRTLSTQFLTKFKQFSQGDMICDSKYKKLLHSLQPQKQAVDENLLNETISVPQENTKTLSKNQTPSNIVQNVDKIVKLAVNFKSRSIYKNSLPNFKSRSAVYFSQQILKVAVCKLTSRSTVTFKIPK